jgi:general secretion pathway protein L
MADWLLLRLPRTPGQEASWILADARGNAISAPQSGALDLAAQRAAGRHVCVLVPGTDVLLTEPELPAKAGAKLQQIVPYALEEQLAEDIDDLHFAIGKRVGDSPTTPVAVVALSLMDEWTSSLKAAGIQAESMFADSDLLPVNPGHAVALLEDDVVTVRPPAGATVSMPADALTEALQLVRPTSEGVEGGEGAVGRGLILYTGAAEWQHFSPQVEAVREHFEGIKVQLLTAGPLTMLAQQLPTAKPINLLQGRYAPQNKTAVGWQAWRVAAMLLAGLIVLHIAGKGAELFMLKRAERTVDASITEAFRSAMPGNPNTADARRQMERQLIAVRGGAGSGLLAALGALVDARNSVPGTTVQSMSFRDGALELRMAAPDADSLDRVSQLLRTNGWDANLTAGNVAGQSYEGRIQIRPRGAS